MKEAVRQEFYKFKKQKSVYLGLAVVILMEIYTALTSKNPINMFIMNFGAPQWIGMILIAIGGYFILMEFDYNTILQMLYKSPSKAKIYLAKLWVLTGYNIALHLISFIMTILMKFLFFNSQYQFSDQMYHKSLLEVLVINTLGSLAMNMLFIAIVFSLANIMHSTVAVIGTGLGLAFFGNAIMAVIMDAFKFTQPVLKWNPFNMLTIMKQLPSGHYQSATGVNNISLVIVTFIYIGIFLYVGYVLFKERRV